MKKLILLLAIVLTASVASAQVKLAVKGGINANVSKMYFSDISELENIRHPIGFNLGFALKVKVIPLFYLQVDAMYANNKYKYGLEDGDGHVEKVQHTLEVPILFGLQPLSFIRIYAGPRFSFNLGDGSTTSINSDVELKHELYDKAFGYQVGVGFDIAKKVTLDVAYNGFWVTSDGDITIGNKEYSNRLNNRQIWVSVGFYIF